MALHVAFVATDFVARIDDLVAETFGDFSHYDNGSLRKPYDMSKIKRYPYKDTWPFYKASYEEFSGKQLV